MYCKYACIKYKAVTRRYIITVTYAQGVAGFCLKFFCEYAFTST